MSVWILIISKEFKDFPIITWKRMNSVLQCHSLSTFFKLKFYTRKLKCLNKKLKVQLFISYELPVENSP